MAENVSTFINVDQLNDVSERRDKHCSNTYYINLTFYAYLVDHIKTLSIN